MQNIILYSLLLLILINWTNGLHDFFKIKPAQLTIIVIIHRQDTTILIMDIFFLLDGRHNLGRLLKREKIYFILGHFLPPSNGKRRDGLRHSPFYNINRKIKQKVLQQLRNECIECKPWPVPRYRRQLPYVPFSGLAASADEFYYWHGKHYSR